MTTVPPIQYTQTSDSVRIAFWKIGSGPPLVMMPAIPFSHVHLEWEIAQCRDWYEALAAHHTLIRYDGRGTGLSDREAGDFSLDAQIRDLESVLQRLDVQRCALFASQDSGMTAITYAATLPERISHLILWHSWARRADVSRTPQTRALRALLDQDWQIYTETAARVIFGWAAEEEARRFAEFYRECASPEALRRSAEAVYQMDVTPLLPQVQCPALILQPRIPSFDLGVARDLASRIPDARLMVLDDRSPLPIGGNRERIATAINDFLSESAPDGEQQPPAAGMVTIVFTDITDSVGGNVRLGDDAAQDLLRAHNRIVREALRNHGGREIKQTGDGIMASFSSTSAALRAAIQIQRSLLEYNQENPERQLHVGIGINSGEPVEEEEDLYGQSVQMAARARDKAGPGEILATNVVKELAMGKGFLFSDRGETVLKGFEHPVHLFELSWRE